MPHIDDDDFDPEGPDPSEMDRDDDPETMSCPWCRKSIYEHAEFCVHCGKFVSEVDNPLPRKVYVIVGVLICLIVIFFWLR